MSNWLASYHWCSDHSNSECPPQCSLQGSDTSHLAAIYGPRFSNDHKNSNNWVSCTLWFLCPSSESDTVHFRELSTEGAPKDMKFNDVNYPGAWLEFLVPIPKDVVSSHVDTPFMLLSAEAWGFICLMSTGLHKTDWTTCWKCQCASLTYNPSSWSLPFLNSSSGS